MKRRVAFVLMLPLAAGGVVAARGPLPWEDMTEADWVFSVATRFATVDGAKVHYPTPTAELALALERRPEPGALRHLAAARRALGDRPGAIAALEAWAASEGPEAWAEVARWGAEYLEMPLAFRAADKALPGLAPEPRRALADERIQWADAHPDDADPIAVRRARAEMFPEDPAALEDWVRALEKADRIDDAEAALARTRALSPERRLLLRSDLQADHGHDRRAFEILDEALAAGGWSVAVAQAYAHRTEKGDPGAPDRWRTTLERGFDLAALVRLTTYFEGQGRGDAASAVLEQMERRYESGLDRPGWLTLWRLHSDIDAVPEAFRDRLGAARSGTPDEQADDLVELARLALRAGSRPLAWGTYNDAPYRWIARIDRTPGFWTGGVAFLLTGQDWKEAFERLETESLPERTFATARALVDELARRSPTHEALPGLRVAIMERHVERGDGKAALTLLPDLEAGPGGTADAARRVALLAMRQVDVPVSEELRLFKARLRTLAADGSRPSLDSRSGWVGEGAYDPSHPGEPWRRPPAPVRPEAYHDVFEEAVARAEQRDPSHRAAADLVLGELDRLPDAEDLWLDLAGRLEAWHLDDDLGPRYERAIARFQSPGIWPAAARWYARRTRQRDLERLAGDLVSRFRATDVFGRTDTGSLALEIPSQPGVGARVRLVPWADYVRLKALERFPHSPRVFDEALAHLQPRSAWDAELRERGALRIAKDPLQKVVVDDSLVAERRAALLFADPAVREEWMAAKMRDGRLETLLSTIEGESARTPVDDRILFDGWSRLSRFERAAAPADRLAAAYPGDGPIAEQALALHRSLAALDGGQGEAARAIVERTAPALADGAALWTGLGELEEDRGRGDLALPLWQNLLRGDPRNAEKISGLATLLWDYGHANDALSVVEDGRKRLQRPRFFAFETGVLREETHDVSAAVDEYLAALWPEEGDCFCSGFERDQRALRRLTQLLGRERVRSLVERRIRGLHAGVRADEEALASLLPLATIRTPDPGLAWDADSWIDTMDMPVDPKGRDQRRAARGETRGGEHAGIEAIGDTLLSKASEMVPAATAGEFLDSVDRWAEPFLDARADRARTVDFKNAVMARRAALAPTEEARIALEVDRARYLVENDRRDQSDALWSSLASRIESLPESAARMHAEAERCAYLERSRGEADADAAWQELSKRYPWSLGVLDDRLAFLARHQRGAAGRNLLESVLPRAASGHREALLDRLTREAIEAGDVAQAQRAVHQLLGEKLDDDRRLGAIHLLARLSFRETPSFDAMSLAAEEKAKVPEARQADLFHELARAADAEKAWSPAVGLWIEALNRRLERAWLSDALKSADRAGRAAAFLDFFVKQQQRSPRDVRWAVAVREVERHADDLDGAIAMAKTAVGVRPERESLWREAADLMVRAGRVHEAADYLEGWNAPRRADEQAAGWRSELFARAGDGARSLAVERAALVAYARQSAPDDEAGARELRERTARAARRLIEYGHPRLAWRLLAPDGDVKGVVESALSDREQAELALANASYVTLLGRRSGEPDFLTAAAGALRERGQSEQREEVLAFLLKQLYPAPSAAGGSDAALQTWWPFIGEASLEPAVRLAVAAKVAARMPGPWQAGSTVRFLDSVGADAVGPVPDNAGGSRIAFRPLSLEALWIRDLVAHDRIADLGAFLETYRAALFGEAMRVAPGRPVAEPLAWSNWLADKGAVEAWSRGLATRPDVVADLGRIFSNRRSWDRFWSLAARRWDVTPLVAILPEESRTAWFRFWDAPPSARPTDPVVRARLDSVERTSLAVGRLVAGAGGAVSDPLIVRLRGPRTLGDVLGRDARWSWPEFAPRKGPDGTILEKGDDRVIGQGSDAGRLPGALWGERPGEAWFALETLARLREGNADAALVPFEASGRGAETDRSLLAIQLALAEGNAPLALDVAEDHPGRAGDARWRAAYLRLLTTTGRKDRAREILQRDVRAAQATLTDEGLRSFETLAQDLGLDAPLDLMDPATPVSPALLAYVHDRRGSVEAGRFTTKDVPGFRAALASRWAARAKALTPEQLRFYLSDLWATGAGPLPRAGLGGLGGFWRHAADWLDRHRVADRPAALDAVAALPDSAGLDRLAEAGHETDDVVRLLQTRAALARRDDPRALALADEMLASARGPVQPYVLQARPPEPADDPEEEGAEDAESEPVSETPNESVDPLAARLSAWLQPFRDVGRASGVEERFRSLLAERRADGPVPLPSWRLAFDLAPDAAAKAALVHELEHAWIRGDWNPEAVAPVAEMLARSAPAEAPRWLERWPRRFVFEDVARRFRVLVGIKDRSGAARLLTEAASRASWSAGEEIRAFDLWRSVAEASDGSQPTPAAWSAALPFWTQSAAGIDSALESRLKSHPLDVRSARAVLRSVGPGAEEPLRLARAALSEPAMETLGSGDADRVLIDLRIARGLLSQSGRAAGLALGTPEAEGLAEDLTRRRFRKADVDAALGDVARIAARSGETRLLNGTLTALLERKAPGLVALRVEVAEAQRSSRPPAPFRVASGKATPYRPRDLDWHVLASVLDAGGSR